MELLLFIFAIIIGILFYKLCQKVKVDNELKEINKKIEEENKILLNNKEKIETDTNLLQQKYEVLSQAIRNAQYEANAAQEIMKQGAEQYGITLENHYMSIEEEYDKLLADLENAYDEAQDKNAEDLALVRAELEKMRATRAAAIEAKRKEEEIKENPSFYCLCPSQNDIDDVYALDRVKPNLHQPRILCMLIWSTYFQKPMTALCNTILGTGKVCGIYKITNQETGECYIGQSVDIATRWKDHAKCGLGIDTPAGNKLYQAMQEYKIWNFSWELLEKCSKEELDEKEKFYISLYDSCAYGYNSTKGNKKSLI